MNVLLPSRIPFPSTEDVRAWDEPESGRAEHTGSWRALLTKEAQIRHLERLLNAMELNGTDVLEIGGGICWGSLVVKHRFPTSRVIATDIAPSALVIAQSVAHMVKLPANRYDAVDVHSLPYADSSFDLVIGSECLHHLENPVAGLRELRRVIRPGGLYLGFGEGFASSPMLRLVDLLGIRRALGGHEAQHYGMKEALYTFGQWRAMFRQAGFSDVRMRLAKDPTFQYQRHARLLYYTMLSFVPSFLVKLLLGCSLEIRARP